MHMIDFEYNGTRLSEFGFQVCGLNGIEEVIEVGNNITVHQVKAPNAPKFLMTGSEYEEPFVFNFQVCKITCDSIGTDALSDVEINYMMRWLNRKRYYKFRPIYTDGSFTGVYYNATFNVKLIQIGKDIVGLDLTLQTDAPYGFVEMPPYQCTLGNAASTFTMYDSSDEIGYLYCDATIKCLGGGDLTITNSLDPQNPVTINKCQSGEIITLKGDGKVITSSLTTHKTLPNDFNYNYLRIVNTMEDNKNVFSANIPCEITFSYSPIRKVGILL